MSGNTDNPAQDGARLNLTKANKPVIVKTNGKPIQNSYGNEGDQAIFVNGASYQFGIKVDGKWRISNMTTVP